VVRRCQEILSGREVAVKFVNGRRRDRQAVKDEFEIMRALVGHANVAEAAALYPTTGGDAIVMRLVAGPSLFEHLCEHQGGASYAESSVRKYMGQLLSALAFAHSKTVAHLDLKPENVLIDADAVKLIDFGAAKRGDAASPAETPEISAEFQAPEILTLGAVGAHTDMWSFGALLYVALGGVSPFLDDSDEETTSNVLRCDYSFPPEHFATVSAAAVALVERCLLADGVARATADEALASDWIACASTSVSGRIPSAPLANLVRRRLKKLNAVAPAALVAKATRLQHLQQQQQQQHQRPESLYKP